MINCTTIDLLGKPNFISKLKKGHDKALKNIPTVREDCLTIDWKRMNIALIF